MADARRGGGIGCRKALYGLANDFEVALHGLAHHAVGSIALERHAARHLHDERRRVPDVLKQLRRARRQKQDGASDWPIR